MKPQRFFHHAFENQCHFPYELSASIIQLPSLFANWVLLSSTVLCKRFPSGWSLAIPRVDRNILHLSATAGKLQGGAVHTFTVERHLFFCSRVASSVHNDCRSVYIPCVSEWQLLLQEAHCGKVSPSYVFIPEFNGSQGNTRSNYGLQLRSSGSLRRQ